MHRTIIFLLGISLLSSSVAAKNNPFDTHDAIDYFDHDVFDRYYYWSDSRHAFAQVGITG